MPWSRRASVSGPDATAGPPSPAGGRGAEACCPGGVVEPGGVTGFGVVFIVSRVLLAVPLVVASTLERHEPVANIPHGADQRLVLGAELGPQSPDMHVHGPGPA